MKKAIIVMTLFVCCSTAIFATEKNTQDLFQLGPFAGYQAMNKTSLYILGVEFLWRKSNGLTVWANATLPFGVGLAVEGLCGYSWVIDRHRIGLGAGLLVGAGYEASQKQRLFGLGFAGRLDYGFLIGERTSLVFSLNDSVGMLHKKFANFFSARATVTFNL